MRTRVKICGITRAEDALLAASAGADAIGFVLWPASPRATTTSAVAGFDTPGALTARVGVFVNASPEDVREAVRHARLTAVQLHGDEDVADYAHVGAPLIKAVSVEDDVDVARALALPEAVTVLVDAPDESKRGGTGRLANWARARQVSDRRPVILAGGLTASNIAAAIATVQPWAIDVSSGVEASPGVKSPARIRELFEALAAGERVR